MRQILPGARCLVPLLILCLNGAASVEKSKSCQSSTVDAWGPEQASKARAFLVNLQSVVKAEDKEKLTSMLAYPVNVFEGDRKSTIRDRADFLRRYRKILTPRVKKAVIEQSSDCLFGNWQGAMIGDGAIWFREKPSNGRFQIIAFNLGRTSDARKP